MKPFGTPTAVTALNSPEGSNVNDEAAYILADELTVWFSSDRSDPLTKAFRAYQASRSSVDSVAFSPPALLSSDTQLVERPIALDGGLTMLGATKMGSGGQFFIGIAQRTSMMGTFDPLDTMGVMEKVNDMSGNFDTLDPYSSPDGNVLYFASDRDGGLHLYRSLRSGSPPAFGSPKRIPLAGLDSTITEQSSPVVSPDGATLYFAGKAGSRTAVYRATASGMDDFGSAMPQPLDVPDQPNSNTKPSWVSADDCVLYITTDDGDDGQRRIYVATRGQ